ncbi:MAG: CoA-binding protein [Deltaproteobacteria bacterium]|nr:CoA-binding protein [Deltaproteobacteria bacterium]
MEQNEQLIRQLDTLFNPRSLAIVGIPRGLKTGKLFLLALRDTGYAGRIYPVHPEAAEIESLKAYPDIAAIPEAVDLAIVVVPQHRSIPVVRACAAKGVKGVVLFTAGFKETDSPEGWAHEAELTDIARNSHMRIMGPNCMGVYCPKSGVSNFPELSREPGPVGVISHSGSLTNILGRMGSRRGIRFSKVVSLGNECDLHSAELMTYLGQDADTGVIGAYLEGIKDGPGFLRALRAATREKPVVLWKLGLTPEGSRAAASHTGALAGSGDIWAGVVAQGGAVPVSGFDAWVDALMGFALLPRVIGNRIAIISGPGGLAVSAAEACGQSGLKMAELSDKTRAGLARMVPPTGTSLRNPVDVGFTAYLDVGIYADVARAVAADSGVDALMVVGVGSSPETNAMYVEAMIDAQKTSGKPFLMINIPGFDAELAAEFCRSGLPFFDSAERAAVTYARVKTYYQWREALPTESGA